MLVMVALMILSCCGCASGNHETANLSFILFIFAFVGLAYVTFFA